MSSIIKLKNDNEDKCFAYRNDLLVCGILDRVDDNCNTPKCPFYKPAGCRDWLRKDGRTCVEFIPPEDYRK